MQIKQVAELLGVDKKEVIKEVEARREHFENQGHKLAKKLTVASKLDDAVAAEVVASFDLRRQEVEQQEQEADKRRQREEEERRRNAEAIKKKEQEEKAHQEAARKAQELARQREEAAKKKAAEQAAAPKPAKASPAPARPQAPVAKKTAPAPKAPQAPVSRTKSASQQGDSPRQNAPQQRQSAPSSPHREGRPAQQGQRSGAPQGNQSPQQQRQGRGGEAQQRPQRGGEAGNQRRQGDNRQQRTDRGGDNRRAGGPPRGEGRQGAPSPRDGARPAQRGERRQGDGRPGDTGRQGRDGRPASTRSLENFVTQGIDVTVKDEYQRPKRRKPTKSVGQQAGGAKDWKDKEQRPKRPVKSGAADRKKIRPTQIHHLDQEPRGKGPAPKRKGFQGKGKKGHHNQTVQEPPKPKVIRLIGDFTVGEFADKLGISTNDVMKHLLMVGHMLTINNLLDPEIAEELALELETEVEIVQETDEADIAKFTEVEDPSDKLAPRPPVVTVMGHVDHGKTSLLDKIRSADVAGQEHGGITQHIGAYNVKTDKGNVVFLDTPGHEAFTEMRLRGANVTDLVILVVAANDGVMPQTVEAISHAKAAGVPIIVAINKMDVDGANPERVKQELMRYEMIAEDYGGDTITIPVSAITGDGISDLLEYVALQTEMMELKANPERPALGTIVESHVDANRGAIATVLVEKGTLNIGDYFVCGTEYGRIRAMRDDRDQQLEKAGPSTPAEIMGLRGSPDAGEAFVVVPTEAVARNIAEKRESRRKLRSANTKTHISLDNLADKMTEGEVLNINLILKGDVQGSIEAIANSLYKIKSDKVLIRVIHSAVGAVSSSDVTLADASEAIILAFNVGIDPMARSLAEEDGVDIRSYNVIYELLEEVEKAMVGMLAPEYKEKEEGRILVQQIFKISKLGTIAGCLVEEGSVAISNHARLLRNGAVIWRGKLKSLRRVKDDVKQVLAGVECGIALEGFNDIKEGDIIETYSMEELEATLISSDANKKPDLDKE